MAWLSKVLPEVKAMFLCFRRDKTLNYFSVMLKRRLQNNGEMDEADLDEEEKKLKSKSKSKKKDFVSVCFISLEMTKYSS